MTQPTRREALITIVAAAAIPSAAAESQTVAAIADLIIPRTDTPGAIDVGVPQFIAARLAANPELSQRFRKGLEAFEAESHTRFQEPFHQLTQQQQMDLLTAAQDTPFFKLIKQLTVDGYYTSKDGLTKELGWHGNTFLTEFTGCTHPEHQI